MKTSRMKWTCLFLFLLIGKMAAFAQPSTTMPVTQNRDKLYDWQQRHEQILHLNQEKTPLNVIMGNSIIHYWGGLPKGPVARGGDSWKAYFEPLGLRNMGFGWDKIENVLWRVENGELDGYQARHVILMIGTNNLADNTDEDIIAGLKLLVEKVKIHQPATQVVLSGILPRRKLEERIFVLNQGIRKLSRKVKVRFINPGTVLLNPQGKVDEKWFVDGLHPNADGYQQIAPIISSGLND